MSERKYNAFISYKHAPLDNKIAKEIQTSLEHFQIPGKIKKRTGIKRFERIFRDLEELPITSDLNDDIAVALKNSDYLIVICSTNTKKSIWVEKEIETFLLNHSKKEIFTVLADGEPDDVIPEILKYDTVTRKLADGTEITREEYIEPLSCDYRLPLRQARKIELPRLAASMLRCPYDELMNRRRQYRIKRIAALSCTLAALLLVIIGYLIWSNQQIKTNLRNALLNESRYNAATAENYLTDRDRVSAVKTALTALPSYEGERPVESSALKALNDSLGTYMVPGVYSYYDYWDYDMGEQIQYMETAETLPRLAALDINGNIRVWDTVTHGIVGEIYGQTLSQALVQGDMLYTLDDEYLRVYDLDDMSLTYENPYGVGSLGFSEIMDYCAGTDSFYIANNSSVTVINVSKDETRKISLASGNDLFFVYKIKVSKDGKYMVICGDDHNLSQLCYEFDLSTGKMTDIPLPEGTPDIACATFSEDNKVTLVYGEATSTLSIDGNSVDYMDGDDVYIMTFDAETGNAVWEDTIFVSAKAKTYFACQFSYLDNAGQTRPCVVVMFANQLRAYDQETGEMVREQVLPDVFISAYSTTATTLLLLLEDGLTVSVPLEMDEDLVMAIDYGFQDRLDSSTIGVKNGKAYYYLLSSGENKIVEYSPEFYDHDFVQFEDISPEEYLIDGFICGKYFYCIPSDQCVIKCIDLESLDTEWETPVDGVSFNNYNFIGYDETTDSILIATKAVSGSMGFDVMNNYGEKLMVVSAKSGDIDDVVYYDNLLYDSFSRSDIKDGKVCCIVLDQHTDTAYLNIYDIKDDETEQIFLTNFDDIQYMKCCSIMVSPDGLNAAVLMEHTNVEYITFIVDLKSGVVSDTISSTTPQTACWKEDEDILYIVDRSEISYCDTEGNKTVIASGEGRIPVASTFHNGALFVVFTNGDMYRFSPDGSVLTVTQLEPGEFDSRLDIKFDFTDIGLVLDCNFYTNIVACTDYSDPTVEGDYGNICSMFNCYGYSEEAHRFVCMTPKTGEYSVGYFDYKDLDALIEDAYDYLGV